jgi:predicted nucleic acid-binding protein
VRLLDADVMTDIIRGYRPALIWFGSTDEEMALPGPVVLELMKGCVDTREMDKLRRLLTPFRVYWPTSDDGDRALDTYASGSLRYGLGILDALIGECAVGLGVPLCTFNVRHFRAVAGLVTEQPYMRV